MKREFTADILSTAASRCGCCNDKPPYFGWSIEHLWINSDGKYTTCDTDGNHEPFDGRGIRAFYRDAEQSWKDYETWVKEHLSDPLGQYFAKQTKVTSEKWCAHTRLWIGASRHGIAVTQFTGRGKTWLPKDAPKEVRQYFCLKKHGAIYCIEGINSLSALTGSGGERVKGNRIIASVEFVVKNNDYQKELLAIINRKQAAFAYTPPIK